MRYNVPTNKFSGKKRMISWRLPGPLLAELEKAAKKKGWNVTDVVSMILDQYCQQEKKK